LSLIFYTATLAVDHDTAGIAAVLAAISAGIFAIAAAVTLAGIAASIVLAGRDSRGLRWLAYAGFGLELCLIYAVTMETMLDTAGFFLAAAVILAVLAFAIIRIEKRMNKTPSGKGAAA
jgi:uncharacterized membrane protein